MFVLQLCVGLWLLSPPSCCPSAPDSPVNNADQLIPHDQLFSAYRLKCYCSSGLLSFVDRRLLYPGERVYRPTNHRSFYAILIGLLLILGGVEANPGPPVAATASAADNSNDIMRLGVLNVRSAANKISLIHDIIGDRNLDVLVLTETWFTENMPSSVTADVAPDGYSAAHRCRQNGMGGGVSVVYRHPHIQAAAVEMKSSSATTDRLVVKLSTKRAGRINLAAVYRPPSSSSYSTSVGSFCTEFADFLDEVLLLPGQPIVCGDFNCPGRDSISIDQQLSDLLESCDLAQAVCQPTHNDGNVLDLLITLENSQV